MTHQFQVGQQVVLIRSRIPYGHRCHATRHIAERHPVTVEALKVRHGLPAYHVRIPCEGDVIVFEEWLEAK